MSPGARWRQLRALVRGCNALPAEAPCRSRRLALAVETARVLHVALIERADGCVSIFAPPPAGCGEPLCPVCAAGMLRVAA